MPKLGTDQVPRHIWAATIPKLQRHDVALKNFNKKKHKAPRPHCRWEGGSIFSRADYFRGRLKKIGSLGTDCYGGWRVPPARVTRGLRSKVCQTFLRRMPVKHRWLTSVSFSEHVVGHRERTANFVPLDVVLCASCTCRALRGVDVSVNLRNRV